MLEESAVTALRDQVQVVSFFCVAVQLVETACTFLPPPLSQERQYQEAVITSLCDALPIPTSVGSVPPWLSFVCGALYGRLGSPDARVDAVDLLTALHRGKGITVEVMTGISQFLADGDALALVSLLRASPLSAASPPLPAAHPVASSCRPASAAAHEPPPAPSASRHSVTPSEVNKISNGVPWTCARDSMRRARARERVSECTHTCCVGDPCDHALSYWW